MFEAVLMLCLATAPDQCRAVLLPGHEAASRADCGAGLTAPDPLPGTVAKGEPTCREAPPPMAFAEAAPGVFVHLGAIAEVGPANAGDIANIAFVVGSTSVAVIDSGDTLALGEGVWRAIRTRTALPVSHVILTHMHPDHVFGATVFDAAGATVVGHARLERALQDRQESYLHALALPLGSAAVVGTAIPRVEMTVRDDATVDLGDRVLDLRAWPEAHTGTDLTVFDRTSGILFTGDLMFDRHTPALDGSLKGWLAVLDDLSGLPAPRIVPGHGGPVLPWPASEAPERRYLETLLADTRDAIAAGDRLGDAVGEVARSEASRWQLFELNNPRNATVAYTELEWE